jgi:hypothetical protein
MELLKLFVVCIVAAGGGVALPLSIYYISKFASAVHAS